MTYSNKENVSDIFKILSHSCLDHSKLSSDHAVCAALSVPKFYCNMEFVSATDKVYIDNFDSAGVLFLFHQIVIKFVN